MVIGVVKSDGLTESAYGQLLAHHSPLSQKLHHFFKATTLFTGLKAQDDLADIVAGKVVGRENETEKVFFKSWGLVVNDVLEAHRIYQRAKGKDIGQVLELWHQLRWI